MPRPPSLSMARAVLLWCAMVLAACGKSGPPPPSGDIIPLLTLPTLTGDAFEPDSLRGKPTLVAFWRPNCAYCLQELPDLAELARDPSIHLVTVMVQGKPELAKTILDRVGLTAPALLDLDKRLRGRLDLKRVPYTLVLDANGRARTAFLGKKPIGELRAALDRAR